MRLKPKETFIYYDFPILFSASDENGNTFICLFAEETMSNLRYICTPISPLTDLKSGHDELDIRTIFGDSEKVFNLLLNSETEFMEAIETQEDITPFLPTEQLSISI
jgi:hypothetical protein